MSAFLAILAIWLGLVVWGVRPWLRLTAVAGLWLLVVAILLALPESGLAHGLGALELWLIGGGVSAVILCYQTLLGRARLSASRQAGQPGTIGAAVEGGPSDRLSDAELDRYARHIVLRELGGAGQQKLRQARVLIVGAGALGSPVALYLAAAGVGRITIADDDHVSLSNLQRQVIFTDRDTGQDKAAVAAKRMLALNPHLSVTPMLRRITAQDGPLLADFDVVLDGTDSFASRSGINQACVAAGVPLVAGSIAQWEGQLSVWDPSRGAPCLACIFPQAPAAGLAPSCAEAGVVGALPGVIGSMMALEAIKLIVGAGSVARGRLLIFDGLWGETRSIGVTRRADCPICGDI